MIDITFGNEDSSLDAAKSILCIAGIGATLYALKLADKKRCYRIEEAGIKRGYIKASNEYKVKYNNLADVFEKSKNEQKANYEKKAKLNAQFEEAFHERAENVSQICKKMQNKEDVSKEELIQLLEVALILERQEQLNMADSIN